MKKLQLILLLSSLFLIQPVSAKTVEVDVHGMTCAFCVDSLQRKFSKMENVSKVDVSLKLKKVRLETAEDLPTEDTIKQAILDAGFTPVKVTVITEEPEAEKAAPAESSSSDK